MAVKKVKLWLRDLGNGAFDVPDSDPPGKTSESTPKATHAMTISFSQEVSFNGGDKMQPLGVSRPSGVLKIHFRKSANGELEVLGSDPPGRPAKPDDVQVLFVPIGAEISPVSIQTEKF